MHVGRLEVRSFRNIDRAEVALEPGLAVVHGPNGAGKTNLLEALYFGLTGRSCRTRSLREVIRFDEPAARVEVEVEGGGTTSVFAAAASADGNRMIWIDGSEAAAPPDPTRRPLLSVFLPDRLGLVKGPPAGRRAHLDSFATALWPARADRRPRFASVLGQRSALLARIRGGAGDGALDAWDREFAEAALALMELRSDACAALGDRFAERALALGLTGAAGLAYAPRSQARTVAELLEELRQRRRLESARGYCLHGPQRDQVELSLDGLSLRRFGSQGQQRAALLALLMAERDVLAAAHERMPLMLLDDVVSELDAERRELLVEELAGGGQAIITVTEPEHVPGGGFAQIAVQAGRVRATGTTA